jgi:hypothetical protein
MTQDATLRNAQPYPQWLFTSYDDLNRPIKTGTMKQLAEFGFQTNFGKFLKTIRNDPIGLPEDEN